MTKQEYYALLVETSRAGLFPSRNERECLYRSGDGRRCAVGVIIPDESYTPEMEGGTIRDLLQRELTPEMLMTWSGCCVEELMSCQIAHDSLIDAWDHDVFVERVSQALDMPMVEGIGEG